MDNENYDSIYKVLDQALSAEDLIRLEHQLEHDLTEWSQDDTFTELFARCVELAQQDIDELEEDEALLYGMLDFVCAMLLVTAAKRRKEAAELNGWFGIEEKDKNDGI